MSINRYPVGLEMEVAFAPFTASLTLLSEGRLRFEIKEGPFEHSETVDIQVTPLGASMFIVTWKEATGATVIHVQDFDRGHIYSHATLSDGQFLRMSGPITLRKPTERASDDRPHWNKAIVMEAMTSLFQRHDASAVERLYRPDYIQHNPQIPQGRAALKAVVEGLSKEVRYEPGLIVAEGDLVAIHGRIHGWAETPQVAVDLFRIEGGQIAEQWDVLQDEVPPEAAVAAIAMFDPNEARRARRL